MFGTFGKDSHLSLSSACAAVKDGLSWHVLKSQYSINFMSTRLFGNLFSFMAPPHPPPFTSLIFPFKHFFLNASS